MPRHIAWIAPACALALLLASCATPQEQCIAAATQELTAVTQGIQTAEANIARGYAVHSQSVPYTYPGTCFHRNGGSYSCPQTGYRTQETPVAIDVAAERAKLAEFRARLPALQARADAAVAQCRALHPE